MGELAHYGVLGMRWGVRHDYPAGSGHYPDGNIGGNRKQRKAEIKEQKEARRKENREISNKIGLDTVKETQKRLSNSPEAQAYKKAEKVLNSFEKEHKLHDYTKEYYRKLTKKQAEQWDQLQKDYNDAYYKYNKSNDKKHMQKIVSKEIRDKYVKQYSEQRIKEIERQMKTERAADTALVIGIILTLPISVPAAAIYLNVMDHREE